MLTPFRKRFEALAGRRRPHFPSALLSFALYLAFVAAAFYALPPAHRPAADAARIERGR